MDIVEILSGEWLLKQRSNGGTVIAYRTILVSLEIYSLAIIVAELTDPKSICGFDWNSLMGRLNATIPWFGAIVAATYAFLYARFSSQWNYVAGLYNQIYQVTVTTEDLNSERLDDWRAAFIEDAHALHLASKPMFASAINEMLKEEGVMKAYLEGTSEAPVHLAELSRRYKNMRLVPFEVPA